ncbi:MAG TPA: FAD-binding protein [Herpetosiphonaceae bacterium]|nr:FAD-binding protein [Herpetosiphonaceae bacterium]
MYGQAEPRRLSTDVLVIGTGGAGLRAAIAIADRGLRVLVVGKRPKTDAHTVLAAGGINAALGTMDPQDTWQIHAADTLAEGRYLGDPRAIDILCREAPRAVEELVDYGVPFAREANGVLSQRYFGAHRYRRTCFVGDYTGQEIIHALVREVDRRQIPILERVYISHLLTAGERANGALGFMLDGGREVIVHAAAVILATGGHIHVYQRSSSRRRENTGDGMALAFGVGAVLADMELVQFHPSGMVWPPELEGTLVTEAVRGEGGRLLNQQGERFMGRYDRERMELSTRDRVALANYTEIVAGRGTAHGGVWLDVSHLPAATIHARLPHMLEQFAAIGVDITHEPMEVAPTAHYSMGGIQVTPATHATRVPGLFAAGEVTAGVHGANRLGGNSLAEILVFGRIAGEHAAELAATETAPPLDEAALEQKRLTNRVLTGLDGTVQRGLIDDLQRTMWQGAGVVRDAAGLEEALERLAVLRHEAEATPSGPADLAAALDLRSMLLTAEATVRSALLRTESRGAHQRRDYPATDPAWQRTVVVCPRLTDEGPHTGLTLATEAIADPAPEVSAVLDATELAVAGRLVE